MSSMDFQSLDAERNEDADLYLAIYTNQVVLRHDFKTTWLSLITE